MDQAETTEFVVRELGKHRSRDDIIQALCEQGGFDWYRAKEFVQRVESEHGSRIAVRQSPLLIIIGLGTLLAGLALSAWVTWETLRGTIIFFFSMPIPYLGNAVYFITGLGMIAGSIAGMWKTIEGIWNG